MRIVAEIASRLRSWFGRHREDRELDEEIRFHIDSEAERIRRTGVGAREARRIAHKRFGGVERMRTRTREARGVVRLERLLKDLQLAHRSLLRTPGQSLAAIVTLGLGIGVATTMFGTIYGAFYRALPWDDPERFVWIERTNTRVDGGWAVPLHDFAEWRAEASSFRDLAGARTRTAGLRTASGTTQLPAAEVTWNAMDVLGAEPRVGRGFTPDDDRPGAPLVALISQRVWEERFGADPELLGRDLVLNGEPATIVGVMPSGFHFPSAQDLWVPIRQDPNLLPRGEGPNLIVFGHLADGITHEAAEAEISLLAARTAAAHAETHDGIGATVEDYREYMEAGPAILINWMLMLAALAVLLIACVNVANLLLARAARRTREVALRAALGAGRAQIAIQMLAESCALALYGAALGAGIGWLGVAGIRRGMAGTDTPYWIRFEVDVVVLLFTIVIACGAGIVAGLVPAVRASKGDLAETLKDGSRGSSSLRVGRLSRTLVGVEVAFSACLLIVSGLMIKSVATLSGYDLPFEHERILTASVDLFDDTEADPGRLDQLLAEVLDRADEIPGVQAAALSSRTPGLWTPQARLEVEGRPFANAEDLPLVNTMAVSSGFFDLLEVGPLSGRAFTTLDDEGGPPVAIINQSFAARHFPGEDPLGHRVRTHTGRSEIAAWRVVVGVVPDLLMQGIESASAGRPEGIYVPAVETEGLPTTLLLRTQGEPVGALGGLRDLVRSVHPDLAISDAHTLPEVLAQATWYFVLTSRVFVAFGAVALFLACVGLLGVVATESERRTREVGVRMALGARSTDVVRLIVGQGTRQIVLGVAVGVLMATGLARMLTIVLFETDPSDPAIYAAAVAIIFAMSGIASLYPAMRAARTDPVRSLQAG